MTYIYFKIRLIPVCLLLLLSGCQKDFDEYYKTSEASSLRLLEVIGNVPEYSIFVDYIYQFKLDTLLGKNQAHTLFIPLNSAFEAENLPESDLRRVMRYNITTTVLLPSQVREAKMFETLSGKFSIMERNGEMILRDGVPLRHDSPLYRDGTFYSVESLLYPRPNLLEYLGDSCAILAEYILGKDSVAFDPIRSRPIGFTGGGRTIYDSVFNIINTFERDFYPVSVESRSKLATMVICNNEQYVEALDRMADRLGPMFPGHKDIPEDWQMDVLIPHLFKHGTFSGAKNYDEFRFSLIRNIQGDSVRVNHNNIDENSRYVCSNGIVFTYSHFEVPTILYIDTLQFEGEKLVKPVGTQFTWADGVTTNNDLFTPQVISSEQASGERYLSVPLPRGYRESYYIEFYFPKVFPNNYRLLWRANYRPSGLIAIYVNDVRIGIIDNFAFRNPVDGNRPSTQGFNQKVWSNIMIEEYGDLRVRFEYTGPGSGTSNGINIDYVALYPVN